MSFGCVARRVLTTTVAAALMVGAFVSGAFAQSYPGGSETPPAVKGEEFFPGKMPGTGSDILRYVLIALVAILVGLAVRRLARRDAHGDA